MAANTIASYRRDVARYASYASTSDSLEDADVAGFVRLLRTGDSSHPPLSASSVARCLSAVRGLHLFAVHEGLSTRDPSADVRPPSPVRKLPRGLSVDEVASLLAAPGTDTPLGIRDVALLEFLYGTGARVSEAVTTAVDDVDMVAATVLLRGKGGRHRLVPVGSYALAALSAYLVRSRPGLITGRDSYTLFRNARGGPLTRQGAFLVLQRWAAVAGVTVSPHTLRHSFATHLLDGGADVRVVQELLGHASVTTTQIYTQVTVAHLREVYATSHPRAR